MNKIKLLLDGDISDLKYIIGKYKNKCIEDESYRAFILENIKLLFKKSNVIFKENMFSIELPKGKNILIKEINVKIDDIVVEAFLKYKDEKENFNISFLKTYTINDEFDTFFGDIIFIYNEIVKENYVYPKFAMIYNLKVGDKFTLNNDDKIYQKVSESEMRIQVLDIKNDKLFDLAAGTYISNILFSI